MSETLKTAEPSENAINASADYLMEISGRFHSSLPATFRWSDCLMRAYAIDVAPLIADLARLTRENAAMREALAFCREHAAICELHLAREEDIDHMSIRRRMIGYLGQSYAKANSALAQLPPEQHPAALAEPAANISYHDLHIETDSIPRKSIFNLPFDVEVTCSRVSGWNLYSEKQLLAGEYDTNGLRLDVSGYVICDSLTGKRAQLTPEQQAAALNALPENVGAGDALAEVARLTKERDDWRAKAWEYEAHDEVSRDFLAETDKHLNAANATIAEAVEIMRQASEVPIRRDTYPDGPDRMDGTFNADPDFVRAARAFVEKHGAPANGGVK